MIIMFAHRWNQQLLLHSRQLCTYPNNILPNKNSGNIAEDPLKYKPIANTDVPARHMDENKRAPTMMKNKMYR